MVSASMSLVVRAATAADAAAMATIYNQGIEDRVATFQTRPHTAEDFEGRIRAGRASIVAENDGTVVGWAGIVPYTDDAPYYAGIGECMIYVERAARRGGVGRRLVESLLAEAEERGLYKLVGKLFTANEASIALFRGCGFRDVGVHVRHGQLDDEWRDVLVIERLVGEAARD
jgi:L-amino acid N-acyltransferase YncA